MKTHLNLAEISEILRSQESILNTTVAKSKDMFLDFQKELAKLEAEVDNKKNKDRIGKVKETSDGFIK